MANEQIRCATRADVAKRAGVSVTVVSYVMNNNRYVDADKRERVLQAARELNYTPNNVALALKGKKSNQILFIVDNPANERLSRLMGGMDRYAYQRGSVVTLCATRNDEAFVRQVISRRFDGIVISSMSLSEEYIQEFVKAGIPTVLLLTHDYTITEGVMKIGTGLYRGVCSTVEHLYQNGCRNIVYMDRISKRNHFSDMTDCRLHGYADKMQALGLPWEDRIVSFCSTNEKSQKKLGALIEAGKVDAIVGRNDQMACIAMQQVLRMDLRIPEDIQIIGFDNSSVCEFVTPSLSSVQLDDDEICREAIELIYNPKYGEESHFKHTIIVRDSTRCIRK